MEAKHSFALYEQPKLVSLTSESWETPFGMGQSAQVGCGNGQWNTYGCASGPHVGVTQYCSGGSGAALSGMPH